MKRILLIIGLLLIFCLVESQTIGRFPIASQRVAGSSSSTLLTGLLGAWDFDEESGTDLANLISTGNGTATNGAAVNQTGKIGKCVLFDGANDFVSIPYANVIPTGDDFSFSCWINYVAVSGAHNNSLFAFKTNGQSSHVSTSGTPNFDMYNTDGTKYTRATTGVTIAAESWYHVVVVCQGAGSPGLIYINGSDESGYSSADFTGTLRETTGVMTVGNGYWDNTGSNAYIDMPRIWNKALTSDEVIELYTKENAGTSYPW